MKYFTIAVEVFTALLVIFLFWFFVKTAVYEIGREEGARIISGALKNEILRAEKGTGEIRINVDGREIILYTKCK